MFTVDLRFNYIILYIKLETNPWNKQITTKVYKEKKDQYCNMYAKNYIKWNYFGKNSYTHKDNS